MKKIVVIVGTLILTGANFFLFAQSNDTVEPAKPPIARDTDISYGTFVKTSPGEIVLSEYDAEQDANVNVVYGFGADAKLTNTVSVDTIVPGANIEISYTVINGKKTAKNLVVELPETVGAKNE